MFAIPCQIGSLRVKKAICDLGASINVMPMFVYCASNAGPLKETRVFIQLADRSMVSPVGVLEDVLVVVDGLIFPADFYVLDMEEKLSSKFYEILLGRPFLSKSKTKIDVHKSILTMELDGDMIKFDVFSNIKSLNDVSSVCGIEAIDPLIPKKCAGLGKNMHE